MTGLPEADAATRDFFHRWLETFSSYVRAVDYGPAKPLFHKDILAFGTHQDVLPSLEAWVNTQWDNVWPRTDDFRFVLESTHVLASDDGSMAVVVAPWTSTGSMRTGRVSIVRDARRWCSTSGTGSGWACIRICR